MQHESPGAPPQPAEHFDVLIVGAGLSGIGAAYYLQTECPDKSYAILEGRDAIGGTWDLFRYPGVRSDSDMSTLGYSFRPWQSDQAIADGGAIRDYVRQTAEQFDIVRHIRYGQRVLRASWSSASARWTVDTETKDGAPLRHTCAFLYLCSGYYDYAQGYRPDWPGMERFGGQIVHPQGWPEDLDYDGKRVVVIGSGATAVTLLPTLAQRAASVTMLQRSPTYIVARPARDKVSAWLRRHLPETAAHRLTRAKNILLGIYFYQMARRRPELAKRAILGGVRRQLGAGFDVAKHFTPDYKPWDQRLCLVPDGDLFKAIRAGKADIVTDHIDSFTEDGLLLRSGQHLTADIIVTATGLQIKLMGGVQLDVDGVDVDFSKRHMYKGLMCNDLPNLAFALGYTNASWTLKCELSSKYLCRLIKHMDAHGHAWCAPRWRDPTLTEEPALALQSGYVQRAAGMLPKQGSKQPWKLYQNYLYDTLSLTLGTVDDGTMEFGRARAVPRPDHAAPASSHADDYEKVAS